MDTHRDRLVDTGRGGGGGTKSSMETCTLPYAKQRASGGLLCDSGSSVTTQRGGRGREVG